MDALYTSFKLSPKKLFLLLVVYVQINLEIYISKHQLNSIGVFTLHTVCLLSFPPPLYLFLFHLSFYVSSQCFISLFCFILLELFSFVSLLLFLCFTTLFCHSVLPLCFTTLFYHSVLPLCFTTLFHPFVSSVCFYLCYNFMFLFSFISVLLYSCVLLLCFSLLFFHLTDWSHCFIYFVSNLCFLRLIYHSDFFFSHLLQDKIGI
jgi:hypothetical protein